MNLIPYSVTLTQIHKFINNKWKSSWKSKSNPIRWISKCHNKFNKNLSNIINYGKFNHHQCGIIIRMVTEHIELNQYLFKYNIKNPVNKKVPASPDCNYCEQLETVNHFLIKCKKYKFQRAKLFKKLSKINYRYNFSKFKTTNIYFFHIY